MSSEKTTFAERLASTVLEWLDAGGRLRPDVDLCLIAAVPALEPTLPSAITISGGRSWSLARVDSDLSLRTKIVRSEGRPLVAFSDRTEDAFQADLRERAVLRRVIFPLARHLLAAVANNEASGIDDERFRQAIVDVLKENIAALEEAALRRTWTGGIRDQDAAAILCDAAFGFDDRQSETAAPDLWAKWIVAPPINTAALRNLAADVLRRRYPIQAAALEQALVEGPHERFSRLARDGTQFEPIAAQLALDTARILHKKSPQVLANVLEASERAYVHDRARDSETPVLRQSFLARRRRLAQQCASPEPPSNLDIERIRDFVYATPQDIEGLVALARVARGLQRLESQGLPASIAGYGNFWASDLAWLDRAVRRLRTTHINDSEFDRASQLLLRRWYSMRDHCNSSFAETLKAQFGILFGAPGEHGPLVVSHLLKYVVLPNLESSKVFFVVLDGCDVPSFLELLDAFSGAGVGPVEGVRLALSAIPTMTGHARRAIFGGDIPGDGLAQEDDRAADAAADARAFNSPNSILRNTARRLFLKGDLADGGDNLVQALKGEGDYRLIAAVFNDVDDALSSKERTVLSERTLSNLSRAFRDGMITAADEKWRIIVTADHGNTPYREPDIVIRELRGTRFAELAPEATAPSGTVVFEKGVGIPYRVAALHQLGAHGGPQHVGYHGGVSVEEMFVPIAILGACPPGTQATNPPQWWSGFEPRQVHVGARISKVDGDGARGAQDALLARCRVALSSGHQDLKDIAILEMTAEAGVLTASQLASKVSLSPGRMRLRITGIISKLRAAGIEPPISIEDEPEAFRWTGPL